MDCGLTKRHLNTFDHDELNQACYIFAIFLFYRLESLKEVNSRHEKDLDRVVDDMVHSQEEVGRAEQNIPDFVEKHKFYQDLRGYVTDMVDCYNEKVSTEQTILHSRMPHILFREAIN